MINKLLNKVTPEIKSICDAVAQKLGVELVDVKFEISLTSVFPVIVMFKTVFSDYLMWCGEKDICFVAGDSKQCFVHRSHYSTLDAFIQAVCDICHSN